MKEKIYVTKSSKETQDLARKLAKGLKGDEFIALFGDLGSGKTTFVQGLAKGLGIADRIISPTFIIIREYRLRDRTFYHVDLYRVQKVEGLELEEIVKSRKGIIAIEWAEKIKNLLPERRKEIYFEYLGGEERKITIKTYE